MNEADKEFLHDMVKQLDEAIQRLVIEEGQLIAKIGTERTNELMEYWRRELTSEEEVEFKKTMDYWDIQFIRILTRSKRVHNTRAEVGQIFMKMNSRIILTRKKS
jgi:hypothetical protein